ncbi:hypothetical protein DL770_009227 [Monosporascus sp. CRB-9-2]|nr:hypothetical protein DL770_009227 [Monosporascus sp. CRB-9-2]
MMGSFIRHGLSHEEASAGALLQVLAGNDTSVTTIRISSPIKDVEAREMPYLQAVIKEGLRILLPAAGLGFKTAPQGGDVIAGKFIPGLRRLAIRPSAQTQGSSFQNVGL